MLQRARRTAGVARLWVRGALRRPVRALAIVAALAVMSLTTIGALVGGEALDRLFVADAEAEWGQVDVEVRADDNSVMSERLGRLIGVEGGATVTAFAPRVVLPAVVTTPGAREPGALLLGLGAEEQSFAPLRAVAGSADPTAIDPDEVIVNARLAERTGIVVGDTVTVLAAVPRWSEDVPNVTDPLIRDPVTPILELTVVGVVENSGVADLHRTPNVLVRRDVIQRQGGIEGYVTATHLSAAGTGVEGADAVIDHLAPTTRLFGLEAEPVKADEVALAEEDGGLFRSILLTLALLVVAAAGVASVGLLAALGEERARELALLRAAGLRLAAARRLLIAESTVYGVIGAALGAGAGIPFGNALAGALARHFATLNAGRGREQVGLVLQADLAVVGTGAAVVGVVAALAGRSAARLVLSRELDDLLRGEPVQHRTRPHGRARVALTLASGAFLLGMGANGVGALVFLGLTVLAGSWWLDARRRSADLERTDRRAAVAGLLWAPAGAAALGDFSEGVQAGFGVLTLAGVTAILCATILAAGRLRAITRTIRLYLPAGRPQAALRTAGAYAEESRRRSAATIGTVGAALFMVAALAVLGTAQAIAADRQSGGFDVIATSVADTLPLDLERLGEVGGIASAPQARLPQDAYSTTGADGGTATVPYPIRLAGATSDLVVQQRFGLADALPGYASAADALHAVLTDRDKAVIDRAARPEGAEVGDEIVIDVGLSPRRFTLIAVLDTYLLSTAFVSEAEFGDLVDYRGRTLVFATAAAGTSPAQLASALEDAGGRVGLTADTVAQLRADVVAVNRTFTDTFAVLLVLALAVAVAAIAAQVTRAARERRADLAVLRAIGLRRRTVVLALGGEPIVAAATGVVLGLGLGLGLLRVLFAVGFSDLAFLIDWGRLGAVAGGTLLLLVVVSLATAAVSVPRDVAAGVRDLG